MVMSNSRTITIKNPSRKLEDDYDHSKNYWKVLKFRLLKEGNESVTSCNQLKLVSPKDRKIFFS